MPKSVTTPANQGTPSQQRISKSKEAVRNSRILIENSRVTRLASIAAFKMKSKQRAAARAKAENVKPNKRWKTATPDNQ
jgi:hypothetical protein